MPTLKICRSLLINKLIRLSFPHYFNAPAWILMDVSRHGKWQPFFCLYAKQYNDMKNQELFAQLGIELCAGRKRIRAARSDKSISIYVNGGTVNITFNEKGGKA